MQAKPRDVTMVSLFLVASGLLSGYWLFAIEVASFKVTLGIPPIYFPLAGLLFGLALLGSLCIISRYVRSGIGLFYLLASMLGMYAAVNAYVFLPDYLEYILPSGSFWFELTLLGVSSGLGAVPTLIPSIFGVKHKVLYFVVGILVAFCIGAFNLNWPIPNDGSWGPHFSFQPLVLCVSWQVMMGLYILLLGGGRGLITTGIQDSLPAGN